MIELKIGMSTADGSLRILDEDRLCYQVLSQARGAKGVRTISKKLFAEWVDAVEKYPESGAGELREMLSGKTEIDKFEYGYFATLKKMAEMALGRVEAVMSENDYSEEFVKWFAEYRGKGKKNTAEKYLGYFKTITNPYQEPTNSYWHGLYRVVYGKDAAKNVIAIGTVCEFDNVYGDLIVALEKKVKGDGMTDDGFSKAVEWFWKPEVKSHTCVTSALNAYRAFLEWRGQQKAVSESEPEDSDRLAVALRLFKEVRKDNVPSDVHYWIFSPGELANRWDEMRDGGVMALSYSECGRDLREYADEEAIRAEFKSSEDDDASYKNHVRALTDFLNVMKPGDLVFAKKGTKTFLGVGRVTGEYEFAADAPDYKHRRAVEWLKVETVEREDAVARKTLTDVTRYGDLVHELREAYGVKTSVAANGGWFHEGRSVNGRIREYFASLTEEKIAAFSDEDLKAFFCHAETDPVSHVVFEHMWSGKNGQGWGNIKPSSEAELKDATDYLVKLRRDTSVAATFLHKGSKRPKGFGPSVVSELLMKFHPESCIKHGNVSRDVLKFLGLVDFESEKSDYDEDEYKLVCGAAAQILVRMKAMKLPRQINVDGSEDKANPDYLTVNEFIWFVNEHLNEIENAVVEKKMEPAKHKELPSAEKNKKPVVNMEDSDDVLLLRLRAALRTKPFAILAGHSGTGKSRMVRKLAYMTCNDEALRKDKNGEELKEPGNFKMIQVKPNWHDSCDLLGYYSELGKRYRASEFVKFICKAYAYPKTPFFVCLDEMNLAPVEQYFAEYLSAIESRKLQNVEILEGNPLAAKTVEGVTTDELVPKTAYVIKDETGEAFHADWVGCETPEAENWLKKYGLTIPRNLFVVGTVNMDESTNQFSRKVLDRAMTIEMTDADFDAFGKQPPELNFTNVPYMGEVAIADLLAGQVQATELSDGQKSNLNNLKSVLSSTSFAVAYRFANEYALYEEALKSTVVLSVKPDEGSGGPQPLELSESEEVADEATAESAGATAESSAEAAAETSAATSAAAKKPAIPSAFDDMVLMKVLPRISGDEADVKRIFYEGATPDKQDPRPSIKAPAENTLLKLLGPKKDTASVRKIKWILARGGSYLSFWP